MENKKEITKKDFVLVQHDKSIHDIAFETKPTTYLKDAMRRFVRNKSSVTAAVIIGILVLLAIFVPIFNKSDTDKHQAEFRFLPPRWRGFENASIFNGTQQYNDILIDNTDPDDMFPVGFQRSAIVSEVTIKEASTSIANRFGFGGVVKITNDVATKDLMYHSADVVVNGFTGAGKDYQIVTELPENYNTDTYYEIFAWLNYSHLEEKIYVPLVEKTNEYGEHVIPFSQIVAAAVPDESAKTVTVNVGFKIFKPEEGEEKLDLYIRSLVVTNLENENDLSFAEHNFIEGNELMLRRNNESPKFPYSFKIGTGSTGRPALVDGKVYRGSFKYDPYVVVFGDKTKRLGKSVVDKYVEQGLFTYSTTEYTENGKRYLDVEFTVLDESSPVVDIKKGYIIGAFGKTAVEFDVVVSGYRELGLKEIPYFIFGTNQKGHDYFKVVFAGLRTSLILGVAAAAINILIGLVWGSISGYYGGTVDLVMERFTEILGGIPWIIIMTLAILHLGSSFEVFLLALILTGWIGIAATTRSQFYRYKRREYVLASRTLGANDGRLIFKHILPNSIGPIVTGAVLMIPGIIFSEATISYLGLGLQGLPSLGVSLSEVQEFIHTSPFLITSGSIVIALLLISFNLFGNGLRDAFNPSLKGSE